MDCGRLFCCWWLLLYAVAVASFCTPRKHLIAMTLSTRTSLVDGDMRHTQGVIPNHVAFIVDGNGRWAVGQGLPRSAGHTAGAKVSVEIVTQAFQLGVQYVTLYLFRSVCAILLLP